MSPDEHKERFIYQVSKNEFPEYKPPKWKRGFYFNTNKNIKGSYYFSLTIGTIAPDEFGGRETYISFDLIFFSFELVYRHKK